MNCECSKCAREFYSSRRRSVCYKCVPHPKQEEIVRLSTGGRKSIVEIASSLNMGCDAVRDVQHAYSLNRPDSTNIYSFPSLSPDRSWLDGWLLGDGCIPALGENDRNYRLSHKSSKRSYTSYVRAHLQRQGFVCSEVKKWVDEKGYVSFKVRSGTHPGVLPVYSRWYPNGVKKVPRDLHMDGVVLREWFLGDGTNDEGSPILMHCSSDGEEVRFIYQLLVGIFGDGVSLGGPYQQDGETKSGRLCYPLWRMRFHRAMARVFFDYIGPCQVPEYAYRWRQWGQEV